MPHFLGHLVVSKQLHSISLFFSRKSAPVKCFSTKCSIFNWSKDQSVPCEKEILRSSPNRSRSDLNLNMSGSSSGSPPASPTRDTPRTRHRRRRSSQFHCSNPGCRTHFATRGLRDRHMRSDCQFREQVLTQ